jgi:hypothetical protein
MLLSTRKELLDKLTTVKFKEVNMRPWLNWIEHLTTDQKVRGSNPLGRAIFSQPRLALFFNMFGRYCDR